MACLSCEAGFETECETPVGGLPCIIAEIPLELVTVGSPVDKTTVEEKVSEPGKRRPKDSLDLKDVESTGRKRAALAAPFTEGMLCEWSKLKFAGGGIKPIIGCRGNPATARHHGPDKDTLNNNLGVNLHRICALCHNRWHSKNDEYYGERRNPGDPFVPEIPGLVPHDPQTKATDVEWAFAEVQWKIDPAKRTKED